MQIMFENVREGFNDFSSFIHTWCRGAVELWYRGAVVLFCCGAVVPWCVTGRPVFHFSLPKLQQRQTAAAGLDIKDICLFGFFFLFLLLPSGMSTPVKAQRIVGKLL